MNNQPKLTNDQLFPYMWELAFQCRMGVLAYHGLQHELTNLIQGASTLTLIRTDGPFFMVHALLMYAANVSKLLWIGGRARNATSRSIMEPRAQQLRAALKIGSGYAIEVPKVRNALEHFDERLDAWVARHEGFIDSNIGSLGSDFGGVGAGGTMRHLDPTTMTVHFRDESEDLNAIAEELAQIGSAAQQWVDGYLGFS